MTPRRVVTDLLADALPATIRVEPYARDGIAP